MPFNCDVCGEEVSYSEKVFELRNGAEIVICKGCLGGSNQVCGSERPPRKVLCQLEEEHEGSCRAVIYWEQDDE